MVHGDDDDVALGGEAGAVEDVAGAGEAGEAAAVEPDHDGALGAAGNGGSPDVECSSRNFFSHTNRM